MYGAHPGYQPGQWPPAFAQTPATGYSGPPPPKKAKGNPIITKYPPPPGYRAPGQPFAPFQPQQPQASAWQQPQQNFQGWPQQSYAQYLQPPLPQQTYPGYQPGYQPGFHTAQFQYQPQPPQGLPQPWTAPSNAAANGFPQAWQPPLSVPQSASPPQWPPAQPPTRQKRHHSTSSFASQHNLVEAPGSNAGSMSLENMPVSIEAAELEDDYLSECYFWGHPEEIDPNLSLGFVTWKAPLPTKRPLPATFNEAEIEAIAPRKELPTDGEAISDHFIASRRHDALISVRQTDGWKFLQHSLIFKDLPVECANTLTKAEVIAKYRDRQMVEHPQQDLLLHSTPESQEGDGDVAGGAERTEDTADVQSNGGDTLDMLGNLEHALLDKDGSPALQPQRRMSTASNSNQHSGGPRPFLPVRDPHQEDILAALGVTGSPKVVYETPGPALGAQQPPRPLSRPGHSRPTSASGGSGPWQVPPPPATGVPRYYRPSSSGEGCSNGHPGSRRGSASSRHTAQGSDFGREDRETTPKASANGGTSRKRAHDDAEGGDLAGIPEQDEEATPRPRSKHPRVDDAFKRRW